MERVFRSSKAVLHLWNTLPESYRNDFTKKLSKSLDRIKNITVESGSEEFFPVEIPDIQALTAVVDKILSRGFPTYVNKFFEDRIVQFLEKNGFEFDDLAVITNDRDIGSKIKSVPNEFKYSEFLKRVDELITSKFNEALETHQIANSLDDDDKQLSSNYEEQFFDLVGKKISQQLQSRLIRQPLLTEVIGSDIDGIIGSKADFVVDLAETHLVIEIDGDDHSTDESIKQHDKIRDEALEGAGWEVWRIKNEEVEQGAGQWLDRLSELYRKAGLDALENMNLEDELNCLEWVSIIYPHLVHRTCAAIIMIIRFGKFPKGKNARVLLIEEDVPVVIEALYEIYDIYEKLIVLSDDFCELPKLNIDYIGSDPIIDIPDSSWLKIKKIKKPQKNYDLIIDNSFTLRTGQIGLVESKQKDLPLDKFVRLRSFPFNSESRELFWSKSISVNLSDLEEALFSEKLDNSLPVPTDKYDALKYFLQSIFRKKDFWDGQARVISRLFQRKNTIVLLPTGGGKSLTYQMAGLLQPGVTLIIDPLIALINDQVQNLNLMGFDRAGFISSILDAGEREIELTKVGQGEYYYVFVAPERLQMEQFRSQLRSLVNKYPITLAVIDEAHCVSEWGHDFRPSYLHLGLNINRYCSIDNEHPPPIVGLTGTASFAVLTDIQIELNINEEEAVILPRSFNRREIIFDVYNVEAREKESQLRIIKDRMPIDLGQNPQTFYSLKGEKTNCGIVFCPHAGERSSLGAPYIANKLGHNNYFTGKTDTRKKMVVQQSFKDNKIQEIVATKAFGMGIDKPNIAYTIHYTIPSSVEAFYQEAGRAGRNGVKESARSYVIYSHDNYDLVRDIIASSDHKRAKKIVESVGWNDRGDLLNQLWLLYNTYQDRIIEKEDAYSLWLDKLYPSVETLPPGGKNTVEISFGGRQNNKNILEKSIFRLVQLGIVIDYDVDWQHRNFNVRVINAQPEDISESLQHFFTQYKFDEFAFEKVENLSLRTVHETVEQSIDMAIDFVYDEIVKKRKNALVSMADICHDFQDDQQFRESILNYLQESEFTPILQEWVNTPFEEIGFDALDEIIENIEDHEQARRLIGTAWRMLDEDPENIALRVLSTIARSRSNVESDESVLRECSTFIIYAIKQAENLDIDYVFKRVFDEIALRRNLIYNQLIDEVLTQYGSRIFVRQTLEYHSDLLSKELATSIITLLAAGSLKTIKEINFYDSIVKRGR